MQPVREVSKRQPTVFAGYAQIHSFFLSLLQIFNSSLLGLLEWKDASYLRIYFPLLLVI